MLAFEFFYAALRRGGVYIIGDLYLHSGDDTVHYHRHAGKSPATCLAAIAHPISEDAVGSATDL